jgi:hypothetical protein
MLDQIALSSLNANSDATVAATDLARCVASCVAAGACSANNKNDDGQVNVLSAVAVTYVKQPTNQPTNQPTKNKQTNTLACNLWTLRVSAPFLLENVTVYHVS